MGLTRIRAEQISDIDYKQAVRVITLTNITLSGGAPAEVDGVSLVAGDRVLVNGQSNAAQNGLYQVQTVGAGSNGTWVRTSDANADGEIQPGMVVMVTQGTVYADTPWKLTTNGEIIIGTTELTFAENYSLAFGNIVANGTAVLANTVSGPVSFAAGDNIAITGNNTTKTVTFAVTGITTSRIANGTSNVDIATADGNVTVGVAGSEVAEFSTVGLDVTGNITGSNIATAGELKSTGTFVIGTQQFFAQGSDGFSVNENFNAGNATVTAYHYTSGAGRNGIVFDTAVTGQFTNGFGATGNAAQNKFVSFAEFSNTTWEWRKGVGISAPNLNGGTLLANINPDGNLYTLGTITATGNITGANVNGGNLSLTGNVVSALNVTGNITGSNLITTGLVSATGNITGGNLNTDAQVVATGNITGGNITTVGAITATGNVQTAANVVYANAAGSPQAYQFYNSAASSIDTVFI